MSEPLLDMSERLKREGMDLTDLAIIRNDPACECVAHVDEAFKQDKMPAEVSTNLLNGRVQIQLCRTGRGRMPVLLAGYCPFCGKKYSK